MTEIEQRTEVIEESAHMAEPAAGRMEMARVHTMRLRRAGGRVSLF